jgi:hypothetical protein
MTLFSYPHFRLQSQLSKRLPHLRNSRPQQPCSHVALPRLCFMYDTFFVPPLRLQSHLFKGLPQLRNSCPHGHVCGLLCRLFALCMTLFSYPRFRLQSHLFKRLLLKEFGPLGFCKLPRFPPGVGPPMCRPDLRAFPRFPGFVPDKCKEVNERKAKRSNTLSLALRDLESGLQKEHYIS